METRSGFCLPGRRPPRRRIVLSEYWRITAADLDREEDPGVGLECNAFHGTTKVSGHLLQLWCGIFDSERQPRSYAVVTIGRWRSITPGSLGEPASPAGKSGGGWKFPCLCQLLLVRVPRFDRLSHSVGTPSHLVCPAPHGSPCESVAETSAYPLLSTSLSAVRCRHFVYRIMFSGVKS